MKSFKQLQEVLKKTTDISTWIHDFVNSDNPKFAGKSKKERIKMAQGAYYSAQKENISVDEEKKEDLPFEPDAPKKNPSAKAGKFGLGHSVAKHLARQAMKKVAKEEVDLDEAAHVYDTKTGKVHSTHDTYKKAVNAMNRLNKEHPGYETPGNLVRDKFGAKLAKEEVELDEVSKSTLASYAAKSHDQLMKHQSSVQFKHGRGDSDALAHEHEYAKKTANREKGLSTAIKKLAKEETLDELSKDTLNSYAHKAFQHGNDLHYDIAHERDKNEKAKMKAKLSKRNDGVIRAAKKLNKEESMLSFDDFMKEACSCEKMKEELVGGQKNLDKNKNGKLDADDFKKLRKEEALDEDVYDTGYNHGGLGKPKNNPHKPGTKSHKHYEDGYEQGQSDKKANEEVVGTDHVNKDVKLKRAGAKALGIMDKLKGIKHGFAAARKGESEDELKLYNKSKSTVKEEIDMLTFKELMENISEAKIDDLKDKIAAKKATQSAYDKDYKPAAKSNVVKVKGHSYGADEDNGEDEDDNNKKVSKPAKPEVKRGRGRPSGSKSGARN